MNSVLLSNNDPLLNVHEIAVALHADEKTVYRRIRDGKLKVFREGGRWLMRSSELQLYFEKLTNQGGNHESVPTKRQPGLPGAAYG